MPKNKTSNGFIQEKLIYHNNAHSNVVFSKKTIFSHVTCQQ